MPNETRYCVCAHALEWSSPFTYISIRGPAAIATDRRSAERLVVRGVLDTGAFLEFLEVHTTGRTIPLRALLIIAFWILKVFPLSQHEPAPNNGHRQVLSDVP
jgi:hypothetical protein